MVLGSQGPGIHDFYFIQLHSCHFFNRFVNLTLQSLFLNSTNNKCKITLTLFFSVLMLGNAQYREKAETCEGLYRRDFLSLDSCS